MQVSYLSPSLPPVLEAGLARVALVGLGEKAARQKWVVSTRLAQEARRYRDVLVK